MTETHPIQTNRSGRQARVSSLVTLRAYEVHHVICGRQDEIVTGDCRGGFGAGELAAFLYARTFPREEWRQRFDEAMLGMENL